MNRSQIIIAIEGIDGAGKTTLINEICLYFGETSIVYKRTNKGKFMNKLISSTLMQKYYVLQVPLYLMLSYKNYILFKINNKCRNKIIIMDRCFLSNICYFYPEALNNNRLLRILLFFEVKLFPQKIFILDIDPKKGQIRDSNRKPLKWLKNTKSAYLASVNSTLAQLVKIEIIPEKLTIEKKRNIIINYIEGEKKYGN